jgi:prophage tail gpP-like protein
LSSTFRSGGGETFEEISRIVYGTEEHAGLIAKANPGQASPLVGKSAVAIPTLPESWFGNPPEDPPAPTATPALKPATDNATAQAAGPAAATATALPQATRPAITDSDDGVAISVDGSRYRFWDTTRIVRAIDAVSIVEFTAPNNSADPAHRETFRPFKYKPVAVTVGGVQLFNGTMVSPVPTLENKRKIMQVGCYGRPGVLGDCVLPASAYSDGRAEIEFNDQTLEEIAATVTSSFGISVVFLAASGATFERVAIGTSTRVLTFLGNLARQRNLVVGDDAQGNLVFQRFDTASKPVAFLVQGVSPLLSVQPFFNPQDYYSHVTGIEPVVLGFAGSQFTVKNPHTLGVIRPFVFGVDDTLGGDIKQAVEAKAGRMFGNLASFTAKVIGWRDPQGELWAPGSTINLHAPDASVYSPYDFLVRSVELEQNKNEKTAMINLTLPGSFAGILPEALPWDG